MIKYNNYYLGNNKTMEKNINIKKIILSLGIFFIISLISIYSAIPISSSDLGNIFVKQIIYYIIGIIILLLSYKYTEEILKYHYLFYIGFNFLLLILLFLGISINGSKCWIILGPISFQPSEFMKLSLILTEAHLLYKYRHKRSMKNDFMLLFKSLIILLIPSILTFLEPDTGVVIIYFMIIITMILYRGINKKWYMIFGLILLIIIGGMVYFYLFQKELLLDLLGNNLFYRLDRILNWQQGTGYQLENSLIAIGSAGITGFGIRNIPIYFPESSTDFIFTSFASCFGLLGCIFLIVIIILFDTSILRIINSKTKVINAYLLVGCFIMILYQQIQNIGMTIALLPITGITLPFISYGGSSLLSYMFILGIILHIARYQGKYIN